MKVEVKFFNIHKIPQDPWEKFYVWFWETGLGKEERIDYKSWKNALTKELARRGIEIEFYKKTNETATLTFASKEDYLLFVLTWA